MTITEKEPETDAPPRRPLTLTSPPRIGSPDVWMRVEKEVDAVTDEESLTLRVDLQAASEVTLSVCNDVRDDAPLYARFQAVAAAGEFDPKALSKLQRYAGAAWYAKHMLLQAEAGVSYEVVPAEVITRGADIADRMLTLARYHFANHAEEGPIVLAMNGTPGHRKLANNLLTLAGVYERHAAAVAKDPCNYRDTDASGAREVADQIIKALTDNADDNARLWSRRCAGAWTLLWRTYADVQATGRWLLRATPEAAESRFPSLVTETRSAPRVQRVAAPVNPASPTDPATNAAAPATKRKRRTR